MILQIAGALAEMGYSLEEVTFAAKEVAENMGQRLLIVPHSQVLVICNFTIPSTVTMGARRSPDSVPGQKPKYIIGEGKKNKRSW